MTATTFFRVQHHPTHEEIAKLAYAFYLAEGKPTGRAIHHWLLAEKELRLPADPPALPAPKAKPRSNNRLMLALH